MSHIRYSVAACQTDLPNPIDRRQMPANTDRMLAMIDAAVAGSAPFLPVRLVVFPEFAHAAPVFADRRGAARQARRSDPQRAHRPAAPQGARARRLHPDRHRCSRQDRALARRGVQHHLPDRTRTGFSTSIARSIRGSPTRSTPARTICDGLRRAAVSRRRHADRPHRLRDLLRLAVSRGDPAARRQRRGGADPRLRLHGSVGRDGADGLVDARQPLPRASRTSPTSSPPTRARACGTIRPYSWPGGSQVVDFDGRILAEARPGPAKRSSSRRSTSARCVTSGRRAAAITCSRTCAPRRTRSMRGTAILQSRTPSAPTFRTTRTSSGSTMRNSRTPTPRTLKEGRRASLARDWVPADNHLRGGARARVWRSWLGRRAAPGRAAVRRSEVHPERTGRSRAGKGRQASDSPRLRLSEIAVVGAVRIKKAQSQWVTLRRTQPTVLQSPRLHQQPLDCPGAGLDQGASERLVLLGLHGAVGVHPPRPRPSPRP